MKCSCSRKQRKLEHGGPAGVWELHNLRVCNNMSAFTPITDPWFADGNPFAFPFFFFLSFSFFSFFPARYFWMLYFEQWLQQLHWAQSSGFRREREEEAWSPNCLCPSTTGQRQEYSLTKSCFWLHKSKCRELQWLLIWGLTMYIHRTETQLSLWNHVCSK